MTVAPSTSPMLDSAQLLASLQHADSFFPAGGIAFSWGLETLAGEGQVRGQEALLSCIRGQLTQRWSTLDRVYLRAAYACGDAVEAMVALDVELEAMMLARESREGSRRAGGSLLLVHERLGTAGTAAYRHRVAAGEAPGHLPIAQAVVWRGVGLTVEAAESISAYALCVGMSGAALRLGVLGHIAAQQIMTQLRPEIAALLACPAPPLDQAQSFTPAAEIAMMRHEVQQSRLFAN